jgi:hypothetical protein
MTFCITLTLAQDTCHKQSWLEGPEAVQSWLEGPEAVKQSSATAFFTDEA